MNNAVFWDIRTQFLPHASATEPRRLMLCKILVLHCDDYGECRLLGCDAVWLFKNRRLAGTYRFHHQSEETRRARNISSN
jgi:hypothetical protein